MHPFAESPLLFPHCFSLSRGPPWVAEPGFEIGPAVQQASELRHTLKPVQKLRHLFLASDSRIENFSRKKFISSFDFLMLVFYFITIFF